MVALRLLPLALALGLANAAVCRPSKPSTTLPDSQTTGPYGPPDGCKYGYVNQYGVCITTAIPDDSSVSYPFIMCSQLISPNGVCQD